MKKLEFKNSSAVTCIEYDAENKVLVIHFKSGKSYRYFEVPQWVWDELNSINWSDPDKKLSIGSYVHKHIARTYKYELIEEEV